MWKPKVGRVSSANYLLEVRAFVLMETRASPHNYQVTRTIAVPSGEHEEVYGSLPPG